MNIMKYIKVEFIKGIYKKLNTRSGIRKPKSHPTLP